MEALKDWFQPLLWSIGTLTIIIGFIRLCKPVWQLLQTPRILNETLQNLDTKITEHFSEIDVRLDKMDKDIQTLREFDQLANEAQINLLRDRLSQGYHYYAERGKISDEAYRSLCDLFAIYDKLGGNSYAETIMSNLKELYHQSI